MKAREMHGEQTELNLPLVMTIPQALEFLKRTGSGIVIVENATGAIVTTIHSEPGSPTMDEAWDNFLHKLFREGKSHKFFVGASTTERDIAAYIDKVQINHARRQLERSILYHQYRAFGYTLVFRNHRYLVYGQRTLMSAEGALPGRLGSVLLTVNDQMADGLSPQELARIGIETDLIRLAFSDEPQTLHSVKKRIFSNVRAEHHPDGKPGCGEEFPHYVDGKFPIVLL